MLRLHSPLNPSTPNQPLPTHTYTYISLLSAHLILLRTHKQIKRQGESGESEWVSGWAGESRGENFGAPENYVAIYNFS